MYTITTIDIQKITAVSVTAEISGCASVVFNGITYISDTTLLDTVRTTRGCDSIYNITSIRVVKPVTQSITITGCGNAMFNNVSYDSSTVLTDTVRTVAGCDSIYKVTNIIVQHITPVAQTNELFGCSTVVLHGITYTSSTVIMDTLHTTLGCDSVYVMNKITIANITPVTQTNTLFDCKQVVFNGTTYTNSSIVRDTLRSTGGCDSVYIVTNINIDNFKLTLSPSTTQAVKGASVTVQSNAANAYQVTSWTPAYLFTNQTALSQTFKADSTQTIKVTAQSTAGCADTASVVINVKNLDIFFVPNTFTPNGDGKNDYFKAYANGVTKFDLKIFNQYGELIYSTSDFNSGWDGTGKGKQQPVGVYIYALRATLQDNTVIERKGSINLVR